MLPHECKLGEPREKGKLGESRELGKPRELGNSRELGEPRTHTYITPYCIIRTKGRLQCSHIM